MGAKYVETQDGFRLVNSTGGFITEEKERELAARWRNNRDQRALKTLVDAYLPLSNSIAKRHRGIGSSCYDLEDMAQDATIGVMKALDKFDPGRGVRLSAYAPWFIRNEIYRNARSMGDRDMSNSEVVSLMFRMPKLAGSMEARFGTLSDDELHALICEHHGIDRGLLDRAVKRSQTTTVSLQEPVGADEDSDMTLGDRMTDERPNPEQALLDASVSERFGEVAGKTLSLLSEREIDLVTSRFLTDDQDTLEVAAQRMGITRERARQLTAKAVEKVREAVRSMVGVEGMADLGLADRVAANEMAD